MKIRLIATFLLLLIAIPAIRADVWWQNQFLCDISFFLSEHNEMMPNSCTFRNSNPAVDLQGMHVQCKRVETATYEGYACYLLPLTGEHRIRISPPPPPAPVPGNLWWNNMMFPHPVVGMTASGTPLGTTVVFYNRDPVIVVERVDVDCVYFADDGAGSDGFTCVLTPSLAPVNRR